MATRPTPGDLPFATDATFDLDGETWEGAANKVDPGASREAEGYEPTTLPAEWLNYRLNLLGQATEWSTTLLDANEEHTYQSAKARTFLIPLYAAQIGDSGGNPVWSLASDPLADHFLQSGTADAPFRIPLRDVLRHGMTINEIKMLCEPTNAEASAVNRMAITLCSVLPNFVTPAVPTVTIHETATDDGTANVQTITMTVDPEVTVSHTGTGTAREYFLVVHASNNPTDDRVYAIQLTGTDPGPRNT